MNIRTDPFMLVRRLRTENSATWKWIAEKLKMGNSAYVASRLQDKTGNWAPKIQNQLDLI